MTKDIVPLTELKNAIIFADGQSANILRAPVIDYENSKITFYLYPSNNLQRKYGLDPSEMKKDNTYIPEDDTFKKIFDLTNCVLLDPDPIYQRWWVFSDWFGKQANPFEQVNMSNAKKLDSIRKERDALDELCKRKDIKFMELSEREFAIFKKIHKFMADSAKEASLLGPAPSVGDKQ